MGLMLDSTVLIRAERRSLSAAQLIGDIMERWGDVELAISVMSAGELLHGCWRADTPARRARREDFVEAVLAVVPVVDITLPIMRVFGQIEASLNASGAKLPTADLLIGCSALFRGDQVVTGNPRHFRAVPGLTVHDWD